MTDYRYASIVCRKFYDKILKENEVLIWLTDFCISEVKYLLTKLCLFDLFSYCRNSVKDQTEGRIYTYNQVFSVNGIKDICFSVLEKISSIVYKVQEGPLRIFTTLTQE